MINNIQKEQVDRYIELRQKIDNKIISSSEKEEYEELCIDLLTIIMNNNVDVLTRLKNR
jgi:hypothetical protein